MSSTDHDDLRSAIYKLRLESFDLENQLFQVENLGHVETLAGAINQKAAEIAVAQAELAPFNAGSAKDAKVIEFPPPLAPAVMGEPDNASISIQVFLRMSVVPTAICHLLNQNDDPLLAFSIETADRNLRRLAVRSFVEGFSATTATTVHVRRNSPSLNVRQLPTFFRSQTSQLNELTRGSLNVVVEDLDSHATLLHETVSIWLLPPTSAPLAVQDPFTGYWRDLSRYLGAFVTPHEPRVLSLLSDIKKEYAATVFAGYQADVESQVSTIYEGLKHLAKLQYVNSMFDMNPDTGIQSQYLRLPRQAIQQKTANCIEGAILFASLLEAISLSPGLVILPAHAIVAWESQEGSDVWEYLDTTKIGSSSFSTAQKFGTLIATQLEKAAAATNMDAYFRRWSLRELRSRYGIWPME